MRYRRLPHTELTFSEIGLPVSELTTRLPALSPGDAGRLLQSGFDLGITYFDTSDVEGRGEGESLLANALGRQRGSVVVGAKGGYDWSTPKYRPPASDDGKMAQDWSPAFIRKACEASLRRLRTDYIDLYTLHHPDMKALERDELFDTLATLRKEGKIRYFGVTLGMEWREEGEISLRERKVVAVQTAYSILRQKPARLLFPLAAKQECGIIAQGPLEGGLLEEHFSGKPGQDPRLQELAFLDRHGIPLAHGAIRFALADPSVVSAVTPTTNEEQLARCAAAADLPPLSDADVQQLQDLYAAGFGVGR